MQWSVSLYDPYELGQQPEVRAWLASKRPSLDGCATPATPATYTMHVVLDELRRVSVMMWDGPEPPDARCLRMPAITWRYDPIPVPNRVSLTFAAEEIPR